MTSFEKVQSGNIIAQVGVKTTFINTGFVPIMLMDVETMKALHGLEPTDQAALIRAKYNVKPGESKDLAAGSYHVELGQAANASAVLMIVKQAKVAKPEKTAEQS